jgi:2-methylcitrate dehydratase PrpD
MTIAGELAQFVTQTRYEEIPPRVIDYSAMLVASTVASAAAGSQIDSSSILRGLMFQRGGTAESTVWFSEGQRLPMACAARVNALMSDSAASDDSDLRNAVHAGTSAVAAAIAVAEKTGASGKEVLRAIALGYDVAGRINTGVVPGLTYEKGFHGCTIAIFGAAASAGLLLKLNPVQMTHALGLAATSIGGLLAAANTSTARDHHAGLAAMLGVEAAQLAGMGFTANETLFEDPAGFFAVYGLDAQASGRMAKVVEKLGQEWQILTHMAIKLVPGGHPHHAIAEAAAQAARMADVPVSEISGIICSKPGMKKMQGPRHPANLIDMAHSPIYFAAAGVADGGLTWAHATPEKISDPRIQRLLDLVEAGEPPTENLERYRQGATVTVKTRDGRSFSSTVFAPRGSAINGIEWADIDEKLRALLPNASISPSSIDSCVRIVRDLREVNNIRSLVELIS